MSDKDSGKPVYPRFDEYWKNRRGFLKMFAGAVTIGLAGGFCKKSSPPWPPIGGVPKHVDIDTAALAGAGTIVRLETSLGNIVVELDSEKAPITVANFLRYVRSSFYDGTVFHRVVNNFVIQGGGLTETMTEKPTDPPIPSEAVNKLSNARGTIAMAREKTPHTATSQFFINHAHNVYLNYKDSTTNARWGYCVFGRVIQGMAVVDSIAKAATKTVGGYKDVPVTPVIIKKAVEVTTGLNADKAETP